MIPIELRSVGNIRDLGDLFRCQADAYSNGHCCRQPGGEKPFSESGKLQEYAPREAC